MSDDTHLPANGSEDRFVRALAAEVERRMEIQPSFDKPSGLAKVQARVGPSLRLGKRSAKESYQHPQNERLRSWPLRREITGLRPQTLRRWGWYVAMSAVVGVLGIVIGWHGGGHRTLEHTSQAVATYATRNGQRADITLLDGTTVSLNVASRLDVPADFAAGHRTVYLTGEALFTVSRHDAEPFIVEAGTTTARVMGTKFLVRHYGTDATAAIAVEEGKVAVSTAGLSRAVVVTAAHEVEVGRGAPPRVTLANPSRFTFATGTLTLAGPPLSAAIPELDRWYNTDIQLGSPELATQQMTGKFAEGSLADLSEILELTFDVRVVRKNRTLTLYAR